MRKPKVTKEQRADIAALAKVVSEKTTKPRRRRK